MNKEPLKIAILGPKTRFNDLLHQFVKRDYPLGTVVDPEQADVCIVDLDGFDIEGLLLSQRQRMPDQPMIVLSLHQPDDDTCLWLKKPLQSRQLAEALETIRNSNGIVKETDNVKIVTATNQETRLNQAAQKLAVKHKANFKAVNTVIASATKYYEPVEYLQGLLIKAYRQAVTTGITLRIDTGWEPIFIYPHKRLVWVDADDQQLQAFCHLSIRKFTHLTGELASGPSITPELNTDGDSIPDGSQSMEAFLWKVSWWNSSGRLPRGVKSGNPIRLRRWPNLTRLWCPTSALRIAALLYHAARTPKEVVKHLGLPESDVYSFISASRAIGLIERVDEKEAAPTDLTEGEEQSLGLRPKHTPVGSHGGFLGKILRSLVGG